MAQFNFDMAVQFARQRLQNKLPPYLYYHSFNHTARDVVPAAERLAKLEGVSGRDLFLTITGAWYHDLGFIHIHGDTAEEYKSRVGEHELAGVALARQVLPDFGYSSEEVEIVAGMILATRLPQTPHTLFEQIIADSDLDSLGRTDFWRISTNLRAELTAFGMPSDETIWNTRQLKFLQSHTYFTASAIKLRQPGKEVNIQRLQEMLSEAPVQQNLALAQS
jgi:uncharacterized protein